MLDPYLYLNIDVGAPVDTRALLRECRRLLGTPDDVPPLISPSDDPSTPGNVVVSNPASWSFPARLEIVYGIDGPLQEDTEAGGVGRLASSGPLAAQVFFVPAPGWPHISRTAATEHDLGAWLIRETGRWLDRRQLPWQWGAWESGGDGVRVDAAGPADLGALGNASEGALSTEDIDEVNRWLPGWRRVWPGPQKPGESLLQGWKAPPSASGKAGTSSLAPPGTAGARHGPANPPSPGRRR
ncbi:hypothetical protein CU254_41750 (plasmid) [Amycolatopsis sp. AA4]|uniref:hypothetical protein n=1 Tax=Actinomycetes TaxID=1760 RepID=UPI0001B57153|nr:MULTISPECIES: hypothetical protein [Actinomycetes]ATY17104.1 hypothetical protein CU254_41750 [Amycolatopsis sp. AA4]